MHTPPEGASTKLAARGGHRNKTARLGNERVRVVLQAPRNRGVIRRSYEPKSRKRSYPTTIRRESPPWCSNRMRTCGQGDCRGKPPDNPKITTPVFPNP